MSAKRVLNLSTYKKQYLLSFLKKMEKSKEKIISLKECSTLSLKEIGGKALNLGKLAVAGFPVPEGIIIPISTYEQYITTKHIQEKLTSILNNIDYENENDIGEKSNQIKALILNSPLDEIFEKEIIESLHHITKEFLWAVRSSATAEDLPEASFAGQQDSFLNITTEQVPSSILKCWASYWNKRAITYRHNNHIDHLEGGIAVVIQRMINADTSGVLFTDDPRGKRKNTMILESIYGLGEAIVSGLVTPDQYAIDKKTEKIIKQNINNQTVQIKLYKGKNKTCSVPQDKQNQPSIDSSTISQLLRLGKQIETHFNAAQDIEWSIENNVVYILQTRPITTIKNQDEILWTRGYGDEYWTDVASPLYVSLLGTYLEDYVLKEGAKIMGYTEVLGNDLLRIHKSHAYFNANVLEQVFTYYPKFARTKELLNYFPVKEQERIKKLPTKTMKLLLSQVLIALRDPDGKIKRTNDAYTEWSQHFLETMKQFDESNLNEYSYEELYQAFQQMEQEYLKHYRLIRYGMVSHSIATNLMVKKWLENWLDDKNGVIYSKLISGIPGNKTVETNIAIAKLAQHAQNNTPIQKSLLTDTPDLFLQKLSRNKTWKPFKNHYQQFMKHYGHRCHTREVYYPCWIENPELIITILQSLITDQHLDFAEIEQQKGNERKESEQEIFKKIKALPLGFIKVTLFKIVLNYAQTYLTFRENQRFFLDHQHLRQRRLFLEYGRRFYQENRIDDPMDIFFLSKETIFDIASGKTSIDKETLLQEKQSFFSNQGHLPPKFIQGNTEFDDTIIYDENSVQITGVGCSPGIATGTVRIVTSISEIGTIEKDDILVTRNTDPAWTPVFKKLSGLITETGGILSHGAVVSREYTIPAITAVKQATTILKNGQKITLDGNTGTIYIKK